ncbi:hypothetical protein D4Z93_00255 [Clostridium fermenticellae]|uniref:Uncharacterized protein n=1 Tax=Clostridium fermenticellae TaxID=2068654 RepID=A0A386H0I5_9CLOT|nr:hypothetical protein [Clostridium fermenticellae]AYD39083.1 hypothetical protein D4Z93_00255 [Clostridium fermenticellae]
MSNLEQMIDVAKSCPGYKPVSDKLEAVSSISSQKSCTNCSNYEYGKCRKNLFDDVLTSLPNWKK